MSTSTFTFDIELDKLLKNYLGFENYNKFNLRINNSKIADDVISEKINNFYRDQLKIKVDNFNERIKIDRTITFSEKL